MNQDAPGPTPSQRARRVVLLYAAFAATWVAGSDWLIGLVLDDPLLLRQVATSKGLLFVAVTAALLHFLLVDRDGLPDRMPAQPSAAATWSGCWWRSAFSRWWCRWSASA